MNNYENKLDEVLRGLLRNYKFEILHMAYRYNKAPYHNQNWLRNSLLNDWGIQIEEKKHYRTMREIQNELLKVEFDKLLPYMESVCSFVYNKCKHYIFKTKYGQLRLAYVRFQDYYKWINNSLNKNDDLISWIKPIDKSLYIDIINDDKWYSNFTAHINKIHTAFHSLLLNWAKKIQYKPLNYESITSLYKNIYSHFSDRNSKILKTDGYLVKLLNDLRNNSSKAHPNDVPNIHQDIGIAFLFKIKNLVKEIQMNFSLMISNPHF